MFAFTLLKEAEESNSVRISLQWKGVGSGQCGLQRRTYDLPI